MFTYGNPTNKDIDKNQTDTLFLVCNDTIKLNLPISCEVMITPNMILENIRNVEDPCLLIKLFDLNNDSLSNPLTYADIDTFITVRMVDTCAMDSCYTKILINDNLEPQIICENDTLTCKQKLSRAKEPELIFDCDESPELFMASETVLDNSFCDVDGLVIARAWYAVDTSGNYSETCEQLIFIEQSNIFEFPADTIIECAKLLKDSSLIKPPKSGIPTIQQGEFCSFRYTFRDDSIPICPGSYKLLRTFTVIDDCSIEVYLEDSFGNDNKQTIKVIDSQAPEIEVDDFTISNPLIESCGEQRLPPPIVIEECSDYIVEIITPNGEAIYPDTIDGRQGGIIPPPKLAKGIYPIFYFATDACGNVGRDTISLVINDSIPVFDCLPDTNMVCTEFLKLSDFDTFGVFKLIDTCGFQIDSSIINTVSCGRGELIRKYFVTNVVTGQIDSCVQTITVNRPRRDIRVFFRDDMTLDCAPPEDLPELRAPRVRSTDCDEVFISFRDEVFDQIPDACYRLIRTWTVINWCTYQPGNPTLGEGLFVDKQVITVIDTVPPIITPLRDIIICSSDNCSSSFPLPEVEITDNCSNFLNTEWIFPIDTTLGIQPGSYELTLVAFDDCGNTAKDTVLVTIQDCKPPTAYCRSLSLNLGLNDSLVVPAQVFDIGSFDDCNEPLAFSYQADTLIQEKVFTCDSTGIRSLTIYITDESGNQSACNVLLNLESTSITCNESRMIAGQVRTVEGIEVEEVRIHREGNTYSEQMTNFDGQYTFGDCIQGQDYFITPEKNDDVLNGVSTIDLILMNKHILGIAPFTTPYQFIAADINQSGGITTADMIQLRRVILGVDSTFSNNTSWKFVPTDYVFDNLEVTQYPSFLDFPYFNDNKYNADFIAIKIGDLNGSAVTLQGNVEERHLVFENQKTLSNLQLIETLPNPFKESTTIYFTAIISELITFELLDYQGRIIEQREVYTLEGVNQIEIDLKNQPIKGVVFYRIYNSTDAIIEKLIVL